MEIHIEINNRSIVFNVDDEESSFSKVLSGLIMSSFRFAILFRQQCDHTNHPTNKENIMDVAIAFVSVYFNRLDPATKLFDGLIPRNCIFLWEPTEHSMNYSTDTPWPGRCPITAEINRTLNDISNWYIRNSKPKTMYTVGGHDGFWIMKMPRIVLAYQ